MIPKEEFKINGWYRLDTGWACGAVLFKDDKVITAAPIFKKFLGYSYMTLFIKYKLRRLFIK